MHGHYSKHVVDISYDEKGDKNQTREHPGYCVPDSQEKTLSCPSNCDKVFEVDEWDKCDLISQEESQPEDILKPKHHESKVVAHCLQKLVVHAWYPAY